MAAVFSPIPFHLMRVGRASTRALAFVVVLLFVLAMSWGRIQAGAHYLTDCIFSIGLSFLLAAVLVRILTAKAHPSGGVRAEP
jgi:membrane-associated phospholipid phosphatase